MSEILSYGKKIKYFHFKVRYRVLKNISQKFSPMAKKLSTFTYKGAVFPVFNVTPWRRTEGKGYKFP
jgi:hypothetical protein